MKVQLKVSMVTCAAVLATAAIAQAAPAELNIFGASAQYLYWNAQAQNYAQTVLGCTATAPVSDTAKKHGFVKGTACTNTIVPVDSVTGTRDIEIRYSGIASGEGPLSVDKKAPIDAALATGCNIANGERLMYNPATTTASICKQVHIGAADTAGDVMTQSSSGQKLGPLGGGLFEPSLSGISTAGLDPYNTVVVPFGFFVNNAVTATKCTAGFVGNYCSTNTDCGTGGVCNTTPTTIDNITREQAVLLFSQQTADWSDFGAYFTAQPTVACLRHAGSGTHSAFDATIMNSNWGSNLVTAEAPGSIWFNQGSTDLIKCVNGNSTATPTGSLIGTIGYSDADQATGVAAVSNNVKLIKYNGVYPTRAAIRNGLYDYYTNAWLYTNPLNGAPVNAIAVSLITFAQDPANVPASKANFWASVGEMKYNRTADNTYPGYVGASIPMLP